LTFCWVAPNVHPISTNPVWIYEDGSSSTSRKIWQRNCIVDLLAERLQIRILWIYRKRNFLMLTINMPTTDNNRLHRNQRLDLAENSDLLERAKLGDVNAFDRLVGPYERGLFLVILRITKHREDAEDVLQEALLRAYTNIKTFRGESRFSTWLTRIGINQALMCLRGEDRPFHWITFHPVRFDHSRFARLRPQSRATLRKFRVRTDIA
jgi:Sigma-70 region 2